MDTRSRFWRNSFMKHCAVPFLSKMKHLSVIGAFWLAFVVPISGQTFSHSISGLGTKKEKTISVDGMKVVFPADEEDVIQLLLPVFKIHREAREKHAALAAKEMNEAFAGLKPGLKKRIRQLLGSNELSASFDDAFEIELAKVKKVSSQWIQWSGDFREIHFWNRVTGKAFVNDETRKTVFEEIKYSENPKGELQVTLLPPFLNEFGIGIGKLRPDVAQTEAFRLDITLFVKPGQSASTMASKVTDLLLAIAKGQNKMAIQLAGHLLMKEVVENLLLHEIEARYFTKDTPKSITGGMARYYLLVNAILSEKDKFPQYLPHLFYFPIPEKREETEILLKKITKMDPLRTDDPELQEAAGRILMMAVFRVAQNTDNDKAIFTEFKKHGITIPKRGLNREEFIAALHKTYPNFDKQLIDTRADLVKLIRNNFLKQPEEKAPFVLPENYQKRKISGLTFSHPESLSKAVDKLGSEWAEKLGAAQAVIKKRFRAPIVQPIKISEKDSASLKKYGLTGNIEEMRMWTGQTALMANAGHLLVRLFDGDEVQIWFKKDLISLMTSGVEVPDFSLNKAKDTVTFNFFFSYKIADSVEDVLDMIDSYPAKIFPVVIKEADKIAKAPLDEQIAAIKEGDVLVSSLSKSADTITPEQLTGKPIRFFSDQQAFFVVVHEVAEADLLRNTIASEDRRWFCDGLANVIAIRECDRRFGKTVGMKTFSSMFKEDDAKLHIDKVDLLKWTAAEKEDDSITEAKGLSAAHYFYATKALLKASKGRDTQFIADWISKINETNWNRTNANTVIGAYDELTGKDLRNILIRTTKPKP